MLFKLIAVLQLCYMQEILELFYHKIGECQWLIWQ